MLWVQSGEGAKRLALQFDLLVADTYWIRAVQAYGGSRQSNRAQGPRNFDELYPLLQLTTDLDPRFKVAYRFGALFLSEPPPGGPGRADQAIALLQRAIERDDGGWEYYQDLGFVYYWWLRDYDKAADWFKRGSARPGAPSWLVGVAATTLAEGGNRQSSRTLWTQLLQDTDAEYIHSAARHRLRQLDAMDLIDRTTPALRRFMAREGRMPRSWQELVVAERLPGVPTDPTGVPLIADATGRIDVSRKSDLWPLPLEPEVKPAK
jgi:tetratricopeptide (TPR) repeat protein